MEQINGILFIDIETVPLTHDYYELPENLQLQWNKKSKTIKPPVEVNEDQSTLFAEKAGVYSEFAKVVCIGFGSLNKSGNGWKMRLKSITGDNEKIILNEFAIVIERFSKYFKDLAFCGHNIKEFDIPFLCRRMVINGIALPACMQLSGKKPWEVNHLDTLELWKFGDHKHYTTLSLLAEILGIPSPKNDLDGSMVAKVYYENKDLSRIATYCLQDVLTTAKVYLKIKGYYDDIIEPIFVKE